MQMPSEHVVNAGLQQLVAQAGCVGHDIIGEEVRFLVEVFQQVVVHESDDLFALGPCLLCLLGNPLHRFGLHPAVVVIDVGTVALALEAMILIPVAVDTNDH